MTYRSKIETRAREAAAFARDEVLRVELRVLEHELPQFRADRWVDERQIADLEKTLRWLRRALRVPTPPGEKRRRSRPVAEEPEPVVEEPPNANLCWHWEKPQWGQRCRGNHIDDLTIIFGSCRADRDRWFWTAESIEETPAEKHGFEESAVRARVAAHQAAVEIANGRLAVARESNDRAAWELRKLSGEHPPERSKATDLLAVLKAAMVAAHPDKGGDSDTFVAARRKYVEARRRMR